MCKTKTFKYDIFKDLKDQKVNATFGQLAEIPTFRQQMRTGISDISKDQGWRIIEANNAQEDSDEESEDNWKTSAYATCQIEDRVFEAIIDTGAGGCLITKKAGDRLG